MAVALTEQTAPTEPGLLPLWHHSAPRSVRKHASIGDPFGNWQAWQKHLARRRTPKVPRFLRGDDPALLWGWPLKWQRDQLDSLLRSPAGLQALAIKLALPDAEPAEAAKMDLSRALEYVALAYATPQLASHLTPEAWWKLVERLHALATDAQQYRVDWPADPADVLRQQLIAGELPLALGSLLPEIQALRGLRKAARAALSEALIELTDGQGLPHARLLPVLGPLFACWTRARWFGAERDRAPWSRKAEYQYQWLVRHALRLASDDGRFLLAPADMPHPSEPGGLSARCEPEGSSPRSPSEPGGPPPRPPASPSWSKSLFTTALKLAGDSSDCAAAAAALPRGVVPKCIRFKACDLPDPSLNSDWSGIAVLAGGWCPTNVRLAVAYADDPLRIELAVDGERMLVGSWLSETMCDGEPVRATGAWERLCWENGKRFDFLELGLELSHGLRLERQLMLGRQDAVLYLADIIAVNDRTPRRLQHTLKLPLDDHDSWRPELESRDGLVLGHRAQIAVMPLALSEWRADPRGGELADDGGYLTLTQQAHGRALCCPLFLDLDRKRAKKERTWRQLTIGESLEIVPHDAAVGFRTQSGRDQWIFYRSLGPAGNRTVLGQNIAGEFSAGPFLPTGKYKEWIEIEAV